MSRAGPITARVNGRPIAVEPRETLLQAALRQGIAFPHGCRVGGCARCKCRLVEGRVRELTESAYLLSDDELDRGFVLACQGVPSTDVVVEVEGRLAAPRDPDLEAAPSSPPAPRVAPQPAGPLQYLRYFLFHAVGLASAAALLAGGPFVTGGLLAVLVFYLVGDALCGDDTSTPRFAHPAILTVQLWLALPLLVLIVYAALRGVGPGAATAPGHLVSAWILTGLMIGMVGTIPAHELTHRTWDPVSLLVGRWLLAFSFDTSFSIEHVYGHHRYVATLQDPATAPRGRSVYAHILASTVKGNASAWRIERRRLERRGLATLGWRNTVLRGHAMSLVLVGAAWAMGGWRTALFFVLCGAWGKALLEIVNYMEHYGIVRDPATPVRPRHSWNTNRRISSWTLFNLTRHSHHHAQGEVPYQDLKPLPRSPMMINGYLTTIVVALLPPLWHRLMRPKLAAWDRDHATEGERLLAAAAGGR
jgi:ferredoxin/fatty-acid desaturase